MKTYKGLYYREAYAYIDKAMINESLANYKHFNITSDSRILDFGVNIGGFFGVIRESDFASYRGYEANTENFEVAKMNVKDPRAEVIHGAVSMDTGSNITFYITASKSAPASGTISPMSRRSIGQRKVTYTVDNYYVPEIFENYKPTHLKIDIEGAEWPILQHYNGKFPGYIQEMAIEIHGKKQIIDFDKSEIFSNMLKDYDMIYHHVISGFYDPSKVPIVLNNFEASVQGQLFGIDMFLRRK